MTAEDTFDPWDPPDPHAAERAILLSHLDALAKAADGLATWVEDADKQAGLLLADLDEFLASLRDLKTRLEHP